MIYIVERLFDPELCRRIRLAMDGGQHDEAEVLRASGAGLAHLEDVRRAGDVEVRADVLAEVERRLDAQREALATWFGAPLGEREGAGFVRYLPGGFYRPHVDRAASTEWPNAARRAVAVVVFLNSSRMGHPEAGEFGGGRLRLYPEGVSLEEVVPRQGTLVSFPADMLHEVEPVEGGMRDVVVDWFYDGAQPAGRADGAAKGLLGRL